MDAETGRRVDVIEGRTADAVQDWLGAHPASKVVTAAVTLPHHNGRTEGVNTKTKMLKGQMYGRADFELLRHRILLG